MAGKEDKKSQYWKITNLKVQVNLNETFDELVEFALVHKGKGKSFNCKNGTVYGSYDHKENKYEITF